MKHSLTNKQTAVTTQAFGNDEKKLEFKAALKQENRGQKLDEIVKKAPKLELKVNYLRDFI